MTLTGQIGLNKILQGVSFIVTFYAHEIPKKTVEQMNIERKKEIIGG
jgi:hypothetical protein